MTNCILQEWGKKIESLQYPRDISRMTNVSGILQFPVAKANCTCVVADGGGPFQPSRLNV